MATAATRATTSSVGAWTPLRHRLFRGLWIAGLVSNIGSAMHGVAAAWVVTSLSGSASTVALLSAASSLPVFLLALPSGALADVFDRRHLLLFAQGLQLAIAALLGFFDFADQLSLGVLIGLSAALSIGAAINMPNWVAIAPEVLPREQLASAGALNSISMNLAGALGPAAGGLLIAAAGTGWVFVANAVSFLAVVAVVLMWKRESAPSSLPAEHITAAVRTGFRYAAHERTLQLLLTRIACIAIPATASMALLPLIARQQVNVSSSEYGLLGAAAGMAAVGVATVMPRVRDRFGPDVVALLGTLTLAIGLVVVGFSEALITLIIGVALTGSGQIAVFSTTFSIVQLNLPGWVRGRGLATAMFTFQGVTVLGSLGWGALANATSLRTTMFVAAGVGAALGVIVLPIRLSRFANADVSPRPLGAVRTELDVAPDDGPVLVSLQWRIDPIQRGEFTQAMHGIRRLRRRDGALQWGLYELVDAPGLFVEHFVVATWAEHERQHQRPTAADETINDAAKRFRIDDEPLRAEHRIAADVGRRHFHIPSFAEVFHHALHRR
jgi:MFS family permease